MSIQPTFHGFIPETSDAMVLIQNVALGYLPRVTHRLGAGERLVIKSGSVFVFDSSQIQRWTDDRIWTASRSLGNFYVYRELNSRNQLANGHAITGGSEEIPKFPSGGWSVELNLYGALNHQYDIKHGGLIKRTFSAEFLDREYRIVAYYTVEEAIRGLLPTPVPLYPTLPEPLGPFLIDQYTNLQGGYMN